MRDCRNDRRNRWNQEPQHRQGTSHTRNRCSNPDHARSSNQRSRSPGEYERPRQQSSPTCQDPDVRARTPRNHWQCHASRTACRTCRTVQRRQLRSVQPAQGTHVPDSRRLHSLRPATWPLRRHRSCRAYRSHGARPRHRSSQDHGRNLQKAYGCSHARWPSANRTHADVPMPIP